MTRIRENMLQPRSNDFSDRYQSHLPLPIANAATRGQRSARHTRIAVSGISDRFSRRSGDLQATSRDRQECSGFPLQLVTTSDGIVVERGDAVAALADRQRGLPSAQRTRSPTACGILCRRRSGSFAIRPLAWRCDLRGCPRTRTASRVPALCLRARTGLTARAGSLPRTQRPSRPEGPVPWGTRTKWWLIPVHWRRWSEGRNC
jgi:hypothetical protein